MRLETIAIAVLLSGAPSRAQDNVKPAFAITGSTSTVHFSLHRIALLSDFSSREAVCTTIRVHALGVAPVASALITTSGLGDARLKAGRPQNCDKLPQDDGNALQLTAGPGPWEVGVFIPVALVRRPGESIDGKVLVVANGKVEAEAPIKVQHAVSGALNTAFGWLLGLVVPVIMGFLGARAIERWKTRQENIRKWQSYRDMEFDNLENFFTSHYGTLRNNYGEKEFCRKLLVELRQRKYLENIPDYKRYGVEAALRAAKIRTVQKRLAAVFPEWSEAIHKPKVKQP